MIPASLGSSSYYSQYMRDSRRRPPEATSADNRLLTDRDAYLRHLEEQVEKVSAACMLASELKTHHGVLERQVEELDDKVHKTVQDIGEGQLLAETERRVLDKGLGEVRGRVVALEALPDRVTGLEVEVERTRKAQNQAMLDKMADFDSRLARMEERHQGELRVQHEQLSRVSSHVQALLGDKEALEGRCRALEEGLRKATAEHMQALSVHRASGEEALSSLRDVELPRAVSELRLAQERAAVEGNRDMSRLRHEVGMAENRMLAALSKQAALAQEQLQHLQDLVSEALAPSAAAAPLPYPACAGPPSASASVDSQALMPANGPHVMASMERIERKMQVLTAAFKHSEAEGRQRVDSCRDSVAHVRHALEQVQQAVREMGGRALDLAGQQSEAVVEAIHKATQQQHDRDQAHDALKQEVCGLERRLCDCWEALHDVDVRVELLHNRYRVGSPSRGASGEEGVAVEGTQAEGRPSPEFERVLELCVSMHGLAKRNARELDHLRQRLDATHAAAHESAQTLRTSISMAAQPSSADLLSPSPVRSRSPTRRPMGTATPSSPHRRLPSSPSPSPPASPPPRRPTPLSVHVTRRARSDGGSVASPSNKPKKIVSKRSSSSSGASATIGSGILEGARQMMLHSPVRHREARDGALEALHVIENMTATQGQDEREREDTLRDVIKEVAVLFGSVDLHESRWAGVTPPKLKAKTLSRRATASASSATGPASPLRPQGKRPASTPASSTTTPRMEGGRVGKTAVATSRGPAVKLSRTAPAATRPSHTMAPTPQGSPSYRDDESSSPGLDAAMDDYNEEDGEMEILPEQRAPELVQACRDNETAFALELINTGVPPSAHVLEKGWTALHFAALNGNEEVVLALLGVGGAERYRQVKARSGPLPANGSDHPALNNTPLHWACFHGHINVCWFLLESGYDPDDADTLGNTCLHLAASNHHVEVLKVLLKSGADSSVQNLFAHTPLDVATDPKCREVLKRAALTVSTPPAPAPAPATTVNNNVSSPAAAPVSPSGGHARTTSIMLQSSATLANNLGPSKESLNHQNILAFKTAQDQLEHAMLLPGTEENVVLLEGYVAQGRGTVRSEVLDKASALVRQWKAALRLQEQVHTLDKAGPILTQRQYCTLVNPLEALLHNAKAAGVDGPVFEHATCLAERAFSEYWLEKCAAPLVNVECATNTNLKDMARLEEHLKKARAADANLDLINKYDALLGRLTSEVTLRNALDSFPDVRLPAAEMAKDYWQPEDIGRVAETEGFPLPPEDGYLWVHSDSYVRYKKAAAALKHAIEEADKYGAHAQTVLDARAKDKVADGVSKILEAKDEADKAVAVAQAEKLAKKLKKGKKK